MLKRNSQRFKKYIILLLFLLETLQRIECKAEMRNVKWEAIEKRD